MKVEVERHHKADSSFPSSQKIPKSGSVLWIWTEIAFCMRAYGWIRVIGNISIIASMPLYFYVVSDAALRKIIFKVGLTDISIVL